MIRLIHIVGILACLFSNFSCQYKATTSHASGTIDSASCYNAQWKPAGNRIVTEWAAQVDVSNVLPEYPRPLMERTARCSLPILFLHRKVRILRRRVPESHRHTSSALLCPTEGKILAFIHPEI